LAKKNRLFSQKGALKDNNWSQHWFSRKMPFLA
jgi:hypothetical protein